VTFSSAAKSGSTFFASLKRGTTMLTSFVLVLASEVTAAG